MTEEKKLSYRWMKRSIRQKKLGTIPKASTALQARN